jgi:hypothetical protein
MRTRRYTCAIARLDPIISGSGSVPRSPSGVEWLSCSTCSRLISSILARKDLRVSSTSTSRVRRGDVSRKEQFSRPASMNSTEIFGNWRRICSATSAASKSGKFRPSTTLSQETCSNFASAWAPPSASSLSAPAYVGLLMTRCRKIGSALAIRTRLQVRAIAGVAIAAIRYAPVSQVSADQSTLISGTLPENSAGRAWFLHPCDFMTKVGLARKCWQETLCGNSFRPHTDPSRDFVPLRNASVPATLAVSLSRHYFCVTFLALRSRRNAPRYHRQHHREL